MKGNAQQDSFVVHKKTFTYETGLPTHEILCGTQDNNGFQWFGTRNGLLRYDGYNFVLFTKKDFKFRGTRIDHLCMDDKFGLIITYSDLGSSYFSSDKKDVININTYEVQPIYEYYKEMPFPESKISRVEVENNTIVYTLGYLAEKWKYSTAIGFKKVENFRPIVKLPSKQKVEKKNVDYAKGFFEPRNYAVYLFGDSSVHIPPYFVEPRPEVYYELACRQKKGYIIYSKISSTDRVKYLFLNYNAQLSDIDTSDIILNGFPHVNVKTFCLSDNDQSTIFLDGNGAVVIYHRDFGFVTLFKKGENGKAENVYVNSYYKDKLGIYWLCTNQGIMQVKINLKLFDSFYENTETSVTFNNSARGIYASSDTFICNLVDGIVFKTNAGTKIFSNGHTYTHALAKIGKDFWFGSIYLKIYNPKTQDIESKAKSLQAEIWSICELDQDHLLLGCTNGLSIYNKTTNTIEPVACGKFPPARFVYKLIRNKGGEIWAISEKGIYIVSGGGMITDYYSSASKGKTKWLPCESIYDLYPDKNGIYWIATNNEGLIRWDRATDQFRQFGISNGFISTVVYSIQEDNYNNLWLSTDYGLIQFNKNTYQVKTYTEIDGLCNNEFNRISSYKNEKGILYFGGVNGITGFDPARFSKENADMVFPLRVSNYNQFNINLTGIEEKTSVLNCTQEIVLTDNIKFSNLTFSLLDFIVREHLYAYKIEGIDADWNYTKTNSLRLGNLPYGTYTLRIKAQTNFGTWNKQEIQIPLKVIAPFYKTWWFILLVVVLVLASIFLFVKIRLHVLQKENKKLETIIEKRTSELKVSLKEKTALIQEIHHRVKNNLQFVEAMLEMQLQAEKQKKNQHSLSATSRRINAMALVHDMLYTRDNLESVSFKKYMEELVTKIGEMVNESKTDISFTLDIEDVHFDINTCVALGMLSSELLSNSIKYAFPDTEKPEVRLHFRYDKNANTAFYSISDNGKGFEHEKDQKGFGLKLVDIFCRQLKGTYDIRGQQGIHFTLTFKPKKATVPYA